MKKKLLLASVFFLTITSLLCTDSNPTLSRVRGNQFTPATEQTRSSAPIGSLDTTLNSGNSYVNPANGYEASAVITLSDGTFIVLTFDNSLSWLTKYNPDGSLYANFNSTGILQLPYYSTSNFLSVDVQNRILVSGQDDNTSNHYPWILRINEDGSSDTSFTFVDGGAWNGGDIKQLGQQTTGQIIAAGFNGTNTQVARYNLDGSVDINFGQFGYAILDGNNGLPTSTYQLNNLVIDAENNIYLAYVNATPSVNVIRLTEDGDIDTSWNSGSPFNLSYLDGLSMQINQLCMIVDSIGDLVVAVPSGTNPKVKVVSIATSPATTTPTTPGTFANVTMSGGIFASVSSNYYLGSIVAGSNGSVYFAGSNQSSTEMFVVCYTSSGVVDNNFNGNGINFFSYGSPSTSSVLNSVVIAPTGQIYGAGVQNNSSTLTPYVARLNSFQYATQVWQYPATQEQGILNRFFGDPAIQTYAGITTPFNGIYTSLLEQQATASMEIISGESGAGLPDRGDILIGMDGAIDDSNTSNMMFAWLNPDGTINSNVGNDGYLTLTNLSSTDEYFTGGMVQDGLGNIYLAGSASHKALLRAYSADSTTDSGTPWKIGTPVWQVSETGSGYQGVGVSFLVEEILLCVAESSTVGHISNYLASDGSLNNGFGESGSGYINSTSYGLHMGPCYGVAIVPPLNIFAAYVDSSTSQVTLAKFVPNGSALVSSFGSGGVVANIFSGATILPHNVRIGVLENRNVLVAAVDTTDLYIAEINVSTGVVETNFSITINGVSLLQLSKITGISDGTAFATFWDAGTSNAMYVARTLSTVDGLDETFNSQGSQPGVLPIQIGDKVSNYNARVANSALIQSTAGAEQGNILVAGYQSVTSADATPMAISVYGAPGTREVLDYSFLDSTPGTFDTAYNLSTSPAISAGFGNAVFVYPTTNVNTGKILVGIDNGTDSIVSRLNKSDMSLDTFGTAGTYTISGLTGINSLNIDTQNNILVTGVSSGTPWAAVINNAGTSIITCNMSSLTNLTTVHSMHQQKSGRYILACSGTDTNITSVGILVAFQDKLVGSNTMFEQDLTFNPLAVNYVASGSYSIGTTGGLYALAINSDDTIVAAYANNGSPQKIIISSVTADGSGLNLNFNSGTNLTTTISTDSAQAVQLNVDASGNILVGASYNNSVQVQRFTSAGGTDTSWNTDGSVVTLTNLGTTGVALTGLMATTMQQTILTGYNLTGGNGPLFAARLTSDGSLDPVWNRLPVGTDTVGVLTYDADGAIQINNAAIALDGEILSIGSTNIAVLSSSPILTLVFGDDLVTQVSQDQLEAAAGTLDLTIPGSTSGALPLASLPVSGSVPGLPTKIAIYDNDSHGAVMIASSDGTDSYVSMLHADLSLDSSYAASYTSSGVVIFTQKDSIRDMYLSGNIASDTLLPILVTGNDGSAMWGATVSAEGDTITYLTGANGLSQGNVIRQTTNGRILVGGFDGSQAVIAAFESITSDNTYPLDLSFGNHSGTSPFYGGGIYSTGVNGVAIHAMAVDSLDRIYIAYKLDDTTISVERLLANGTDIDTTFSATFTTGTTYSESQIHLALDMSNDQLVVAAQDGIGTGNIIQLCRFSMVDGSASGAISTITLASKVLNLSDLFIDAAENIYVIGYNATDNKSVVARVASTSSTMIALDATYATTGIANLATGAMTVVTAGAYNPDRRTYLVGSDGSTTAYMARFFGDIYTSQVSQAITTATVGSLDTSLQPNNTGQIDLSAQTGWSGLAGGYIARAIIENPNNDGTSFIAFGDGTNLIVGKVDADMNPVTSFGDGGYSPAGLTASQSMGAVNGIAIDAQGNILVVGDNIYPGYLFDSTGANIAILGGVGVNYVATAVGTQKSGRYIVGINGNSYGYIYAYKNPSSISFGQIDVDVTFGPANQNGSYTIGNNSIDDLCIDNNDNIYFTYCNGSNNVCLGKLTANGSGLVDDQNSPAAFNAGTVITTDIMNATYARIAINSNGDILVGATTSSGVQVALFDGITGVQIGTTVTVLSANSPSLSKLVGSGTDFYGTAYDTTPSTSVFAITNSGVLDSGFGTSGVTTTSVGSVQAVYGLSVQADGKLVVVGNSTPYADSPSLIRFYGYPYVAQYAQAPDQVAAGILDTTLWPTSGAFALNNTTDVTFNSLISGYAVQRVYESGNGVMTFVADNGNDTTIFQMNKDLTLNTAFSTDGYRTFMGSYGQTTGLFVDSLGNFYVCGNNGGASWMIGMDATGADLSPGFSPSSTLTEAYATGQQSNGRVILAGLGATNGTLKGYTNSGALDATFAGTAAGTLDMGGGYAITDITIDAYDRIIAVANNAGTVVLKRTDASGSTVTTLSDGTAITGAVGNVKVCLDASGYIVVAAATATGYIIRSYNNDATGTNNASAVTITAGTTPVLSNMYATSDGKITLVGYDSATGDAFTARLVSGSSSLALDTTTFNAAGTPGYILTSLAAMDQVFDGIIHADDRIMLVGSNATSAAPYMGRVFGDDYVSYVSQGAEQGTAGTINTTFGDTTPPTGSYDLATLNPLLTGAQGKALLPLTDGGYFQAFDLANTGSDSILIKTVASGALDTTYNTTGIATTYAPLGVNSMLEDGSGNVLLVGTTGGAGWVQRYTSAGALDTTFNSTGSIAPGTQATVAVEQTLARLVVAGMNSSGKGALFAYQSLSPNGTPGAVDTTFNSTGTAGAFATTIANVIPTLVADEYDRLIFAILHGTVVDLYRLTPTGQLDATFGTSGVVAGAITSASTAHSVRVALDAAGNIIVAVKSLTTNTFSVRAYDNGISTDAGANGDPVYAQLNISSLTGPTVTNLVTSADGYAYVLGIQSGTNAAWIARITAGGALDTTGFNSEAVGGIAGIFQYTGSGTTAHVYSGLAVNADGTLGMLGYEDSSSSYTPMLVSVYNDPYTSQESQSPDAQPVGTNDRTLGVSQVSKNSKGISFYGTTGVTASAAQVARSLGLYDDNNLVVAIDGYPTDGGTNSQIFINMFDNDGILNPDFGTDGQATALTMYQNQYVQDMVTFTTANNVTKAILAGYVYNSNLGTNDSLLLQYTLTPGSSGIDSSFGGYQGNPAGIAFGDGQSLYSVGLQSTGRIVAAGLSQDDQGLLLGYTTDGKLDFSFGNNGYQSSTGASAIYNHVIDTQNRIIFGYEVSGDATVSRFLADGSMADPDFTASVNISSITDAQSIQVAIDSSDNIYLAATTSFGNSIVLHRYQATNGDLLESATLSGIDIAGAALEYAEFSLRKMIVDEQGNVVVVAYAGGSYNDQVFVMRLVPTYGSFELDLTFNYVDGTHYGYILYQVVSGEQQVTDAMIHPDGRILITGSQDSLFNASFSYSFDSDDEVSFNSSATFGGTTPYTYAWNFGDGGTSISENPTHTYSSSGDYTITLTVTDANLLTSSTSDNLIIVDPLNASFSYSFDSDTQVSFDSFGTSGGSGSNSYAWDFGDSTTSTSENPTHTYSSPGTYTVTLTVTDLYGSSDETSDSVTIVDPLSVSFSYSFDSDTQVSFDSSGTSGGSGSNSYSWDFGDGSGTSTSANPTYDYSSPGDYTVTLTVTDLHGSSDETSDSVTIVDPLSVSFSYSYNSDTQVSFDSSSTSGGSGSNSYLWDFGDSTTSTSAHPTHTYASEDDYTVTLTVTDLHGSSDEASDDVSIIFVAAGFDYSYDTDYQVAFSSSGAAGQGSLTYLWNFGDSTTSTSANPTHTYAAEGDYTVRLTVTDSTGSSTYTEQSVSIVEVFAFFTPSNGTLPYAFNFSSSGSVGQGTLTYAWAFGDGGTSTLANPSHTYTSNGNFSVALTVTDANGSQSIWTQSVRAPHP